MRIKLVEILKFIVCVAIGFTLRIMFENSNRLQFVNKNCAVAKDSYSDLLLNNIHEQLRQPYQPKSFLDVIEFRYFNLSKIFDTHLGQIETNMKSYHQSDIRDIINQVVPQINHGQINKYKLKSFLNGFERIDPVRGKEYVLDLELVLENRDKFLPSHRIHRLSLIKPFTYIQIVSHIDVTPTKDSLINLIYTCSQHHERFIESLLKFHEDNIVNLFPVNVTLYLCSGGNSHEGLISMVNQFIKKHESSKSYKLHLKLDPGCTYNATSVINKAVKQLGNTDSKLVILDVNVNVTHQFLQRCFSILSENSNAVYIPIPFARFLSRDSEFENILNKESGNWDHENREILCINENTFNKAGGLFERETSDKAHLSFINKLIGLKKEIFRSTDPSVGLSYHQIDCNTQARLFYSSQEYCEIRQRRTFQSISKSLSMMKLS